MVAPEQISVEDQVAWAIPMTELGHILEGGEVEKKKRDLRSHDVDSSAYIALVEWPRQHKRSQQSPNDLVSKFAEIVGRWREFCFGNHSFCCIRELRSIFPDDIEILLVDTARLCLIRGRTTYRYLALSYVWGETRQFNSTVSNIDSLFEPDSLLKVWVSILRVVREAIDFTHLINERFLWVDTLCIVQDDYPAKKRQLDLMGEIYNSASITLVAGAGESGDSALISRKCRSTLNSVEAEKTGQDKQQSYIHSMEV